MIIDVNSYIGHWPFRQITNSTAEGLIKRMDGAEIEKAAVSSINAIFYKDSQQGNLELIEQINDWKDRFIPFAVINPTYPGWKKDFLYCIDILGMKGLELYPYYHQYNLNDEPSVELLNLAAEKKIPVHLPCAVEDLRQRHWMDRTRNLKIDELEQALTLCPDTDFIVTNGSTHTFAKHLKTTTDKRNGKVFYDFARVEVFTPAFDSLLEAAGADHIVFGSVHPFQYVDTQLIKLHYSSLNNIEKEKIMSRNLKELFQL